MGEKGVMVKAGWSGRWSGTYFHFHDTRKFCVLIYFYRIFGSFWVTIWFPLSHSLNWSRCASHLSHSSQVHPIAGCQSAELCFACSWLWVSWVTRISIAPLMALSFVLLIPCASFLSLYLSTVRAELSFACCWFQLCTVRESLDSVESLDSESLDSESESMCVNHLSQHWNLYVV